MLNVLTAIPDGLLELDALRLHEILPGPTLLQLPGRRPEPLFVSVLLHGNEDVGWLAVRALLRNYLTKDLPRALTVFIGNVAAARANQRFLPEQPDYNRMWQGGSDVDGRPEQRMVQEVLQWAHASELFACIDIHNTTGINPHYASLRRTDHRSLQLATLFSRTVVYYRRPKGVLIAAFSDLCPAVTVECGKPGQEQGVTHALDYIDACLHLSEIPNHAVSAHDIDLFHTIATVKVPASLSLGFAGDDDIRLVNDLDHLNFRELPVGTTLGWVRSNSNVSLDVRDESGADVSEHFFDLQDGEIRTRLPVIPAMLTLSVQAIRQDCLCYLMERYEQPDAATQALQSDTSPTV